MTLNRADDSNTKMNVSRCCWSRVVSKNRSVRLLKYGRRAQVNRLRVRWPSGKREDAKEHNRGSILDSPITNSILAGGFAHFHVTFQLNAKLAARQILATASEIRFSRDTTIQLSNKRGHSHGARPLRATFLRILQSLRLFTSRDVSLESKSMHSPGVS